jgi:hypothetical protein
MYKNASLLVPLRSTRHHFAMIYVTCCSWPRAQAKKKHLCAYALESAANGLRLYSAGLVLCIDEDFIPCRLNRMC